ncbi:MAG: hypothetical protein ACRCTZ_00055 [Sarcina sp.]
MTQYKISFLDNDKKSHEFTIECSELKPVYKAVNGVPVRTLVFKAISDENKKFIVENFFTASPKELKINDKEIKNVHSIFMVDDAFYLGKVVDPLNTKDEVLNLEINISM